MMQSKFEKNKKKPAKVKRESDNFDRYNFCDWNCNDMDRHAAKYKLHCFGHRKCSTR